MKPEKKILGVCAWLAEKFNLDVSGLRLLFVAATILGLGSPILIYLILYLVMPRN
ncbi:MAG TPA: PspC domain-containing protein [Chitinophagales bacterium]|nr:PspC domain-containing protein [Chitinophagales bacterium]